MTDGEIWFEHYRCPYGRSPHLEPFRHTWNLSGSILFRENRSWQTVRSDSNITDVRMVGHHTWNLSGTLGTFQAVFLSKNTVHDKRWNLIRTFQISVSLVTTLGTFQAHLEPFRQHIFQARPLMTDSQVGFEHSRYPYGWSPHLEPFRHTWNLSGRILSREYRSWPTVRFDSIIPDIRMVVYLTWHLSGISLKRWYFFQIRSRFTDSEIW